MPPSKSKIYESVRAWPQFVSTKACCPPDEVDELLRVNEMEKYIQEESKRTTILPISLPLLNGKKVAFTKSPYQLAHETKRAQGLSATDNGNGMGGSTTTNKQDARNHT